MRWMRIICLSALCLVSAVVIAQPQEQQAQKDSPPAQLNDSIDQSAVSLPRDNKMKSRIEAAQDYIKSEDWAEACNVLQKLIDIREDVFAELGRKGPDGKDSTSLVSVRTEANRMVAALPPKGLEFYKLTFNAPASAMLKEARAKGDANLLAQIVRQYLHTDPGAEAAILLGTYQLDRGNFMAASLVFEKLLEREGADKLSPRTLFKAAYAFYQAGDTSRGARVWQMLASRGLRELNIGGTAQPLEELKKLASTQSRSGDSGIFDWLLFWGNPKRSAQMPGGTAFLEPRWKLPTAKLDQTKSWLRMAENQLQQQRQQAPIPAFSPLAITVTKNDQKVPLLVYRSYWGIHAVQMKTGKLEWEARSDWALETALKDNRKEQAISNWLNSYVNNQFNRPGIVFENSSMGTFSSDGKYLFAVEDLAVPPPPMNNAYAPGNNARFGVTSKEVIDSILHAKLQAYDLVTGKLRWEIGAHAEKGDLVDTYFLGPPLPISGKLFALTEKQQELRLATLDPATGKLLAMQTLVTTRDKLEQDIGRRSQAAHLAFGEGILVCPTNAGALLGVDLLTNSLVWAYMYRDKAEGTDVNQGNGAQPLPGRIRIGINRVQNPNQNNQWKVTAPIILDGKVIFTAPDARAVHCVNLRDGTKIWSHNRQEEDIYLGGVVQNKVLVVGRKSCRGLDLSTGQTAWTLETGVPSGIGITSENIYYLPLKEGITSKEPEIVAIDVARGQVGAHTRSRKKEVPGNLLFYEGEVISQGTSDLVAYPQLAVKLEQIDQLIKANPKDPLGLTERGELRLDKGDLAGAIEDLQMALEQKPNATVTERARLKLYESFTDYFQRDFNKAEKFLDEYQQLCKVEIPEKASDTERKEKEAEQRRRKANFLCLVAKGRESQGRLVEAFEKYLEFASIALPDELISVIDEPSVRSAADVWSQGRIAAMVASASPEQRKPLEEKIQGQWEELKKKNLPLEDLKKFVAVCGSLFTVGKEARLQLAIKLSGSKDADAMLLVEQNLQPLLGDNGGLGARSAEILAKTYASNGLLEDALYYYRKLGSDYANVTVDNGRKGSDLLNAIASDKRFEALLSGTAAQALPRRIKVSEERGNFHQQTQVYRFEKPETDLPYFQRHRFALRFDFHALKLMDGNTNEEAWSKNITRTLFQNLLYGNGQPHLVRFQLQTQGHLVILPLGHIIFAIDPVGKRVLWEKNLFNPAGNTPGQTNSSSPPGYNQLNIDPDGTLRVLYPDGWGQRIGNSNPLASGVATLQTREGLIACDPVTGRTLWTRSDVNSRAVLFTDGNLLYVVDMSPENNPTATRALRAYDGVTVKVPDFTADYNKRIRIMGGQILAADTENNGGITLRMHDVQTGKDTWKQSLPAGSLVVRTDEDPKLASALEPDGTLRAWKFPEGKMVLNTKVDPKFITKGAIATLLSDANFYYLAFKGSVNANIMPWGDIQSNLMPGNGMRAVPVNGEFYAFERSTGKMRWHNPVPHQMVVLDSFNDLPMVLFTSRFHKMIANGQVRNVVQVVAAKAIDKRTGKLIYDNENIPNGIQFHSLQKDAKKGRFEFTNYQLRITFQTENDSPPDSEPGKAKKDS